MALKFFAFDPHSLVDDQLRPIQILGNQYNQALTAMARTAAGVVALWMLVVVEVTPQFLSGLHSYGTL